MAFEPLYPEGRTMNDRELKLVDYLADKYLTPKGNVSCVFSRQMDLATPEIRKAVWDKIGSNRKFEQPKKSKKRQAVKLAIREENETTSTPFICCNGQIVLAPRCPICGKGENGRNVKIENRRWVCLRLYDDDFDLLGSLAEKTGSHALYDALEKIIPTVNNLTHEDVPTPTRKPKRVGVSHALNNAIVAKMEELNAGIPASSSTARATFVQVMLIAARKFMKEHTTRLEDCRAD